MKATMTVRHLGAVDIEFVRNCGFRGGKEWPHDEWSVTLTNNDKSMTTAYHTGIGHRKVSPVDRRYYMGPETVKFKIEDVVGSLFLDAQSGSESFEDFCSNSGYDTDSRKALDMYLKCQETDTSLRKLFGAEYASVMAEVADQ